ncbi:hypothetical protein BBP40_001428 [Aspergillus hancockii]|nr:hypothetical protein BBP40_001428 [Aspergillus hancockii]
MSPALPRTTLIERASKVIDGADGNSCATLERELNRKSFEGCGNLGGKGRGLGNFTVSSFGNPSTVSNSSNCWPVRPKSDQLAEITVDTALAYKITPVLTIFYGDGNNSLVDRASSQMTCLKVITEEHPDDDENGSQNSATGLQRSWLAVGMDVFMTVLLRD